MNQMTTSITRRPAPAVLLGLAAAALALPAPAALAGTEVTTDTSKSPKEVLQRPERKPRFYVSLGGGAEFDGHATKWISNGEGSLTSGALLIGGVLPSGLPAPGLPVTLPVTITSKDFHNTHEVTAIARAEAGYIVTDWLSVFGGFTYEHAHGDQAVRFGQVRDPGGFFGNTDAVRDLYANLGDYEAYTGRAGFNLALPRTILDFIHAPKAIKPFVSYSAGGKFVEPSNAQFFSPGLIDTGRFKLYDASWVFTNDLQFGYELNLTRNLGIFFQSGYGYDTKLERNSNGGRSPQAAGLSGTNKGSDRFYSTVNLSAKARF